MGRKMKAMETSNKSDLLLSSIIYPNAKKYIFFNSQTYPQLAVKA